MHFLRSFFWNFFVIFFANHILPGIDVMKETKITHIGADLIFAIALAVINALIYPVLKLSGRASVIQIAGLALIINFVAFALVKVLPLGIRILTIEGYVYASLLVTVCSFITNFLDAKQGKPPL